MSQIKYNELCNEIIKNDNLDEKERLIFYELHQVVSKPNSELLDRLINSWLRLKKGDYLCQLPENERKQLLILLNKKRNEIGLSRNEYEYLAFLKWKYEEEDFSFFPRLPNIIEITHEQFAIQFAYNDQRKELNSYLIESLNKCCFYYKLDNLDLIVGGSYCDISNQHPNDIDLILLLPKEIFQNDRQNSISNKIILEFKINGKKKIDLLKLPENFDLEHFMSFELLSLLGNNALERKTDYIKDNKYTKRHIYKFKHTKLLDNEVI